MSTYKDINKDIKTHGGKAVKSCHIAHVKELNGLPVRKAWNRKGKRKYPCPQSIRPRIEAAMKRLGII